MCREDAAILNVVEEEDEKFVEVERVVYKLHGKLVK